MQEAPDGLPVLGPGARLLGVRPGIDVLAVNPSDVVAPAQGGMSVSLHQATNLPVFRRPPEFGGTGYEFFPNLAQEGLAVVDPTFEQALRSERPLEAVRKIASVA